MWLGKLSEGVPWKGSRDVHAAGLRNVSIPSEPRRSSGNSSLDIDLSDDGGGVDDYNGNDEQYGHDATDDVFLIDQNSPDRNTDSYYDDYYSDSSQVDVDSTTNSNYDDYYDDRKFKNVPTDENQNNRKFSRVYRPSMNAQPPQNPKKSVGSWSVDLAIGYPWTIRSKVNFSGVVVLHFTDTVLSGAFQAGNISLHKDFDFTTNASEKSSGGNVINGENQRDSDSGSDSSHNSSATDSSLGGPDYGAGGVDGSISVGNETKTPPEGTPIPIKSDDVNDGGNDEELINKVIATPKRNDRQFSESSAVSWFVLIATSIFIACCIMILTLRCFSCCCRATNISFERKYFGEPIRDHTRGVEELLGDKSINHIQKNKMNSYGSVNV